MPTTFTRYPVETEPKDPGIGGKPPVDRRPTGGGGSGDDDEWKKLGRSGPGELLRRFRLVTFFILAGDMMFFLALAAMFFAHQGTAGHIDARTSEFIGDWHPVQLPPILFLNTAVLLLSSLTIEAARRHIFYELDVVEEWLGLGRPALRRTLPWLAATLILGCLFVAGQWTAWTQLTRQGFAFDHWATPAIYFFYVITGVHAIHLVLGLLALAVSFFCLAMLRKVEYRQIAVDCLSWYWHAMGLAWLLLFALLALG